MGESSPHPRRCSGSLRGVVTMPEVGSGLQRDTRYSAVHGTVNQEKVVSDLRDLPLSGWAFMKVDTSASL